MDLREAFFSAKNRKRKTITLELAGEMRTIELRYCSLAQREKIVRATNDADKLRGAQKAACLATLYLAYYPDDYSDEQSGTSKAGTRLLTEKDMALLYGDGKDERPEAEFVAFLVDSIAKHALRMLHGISETCPKCSASVSPGQKYCGECAEPIPVVDPMEAAQKK